MDFEIVSEISDIETFAAGVGVRDRKRLWKMYGRGRWRKRKGVANVRLISGRIRLAEIHWYEAHGIGRREFKLNFRFSISMRKSQKHSLAICLNNDGYPASLETGKLYRVVDDAEAAKEGYIRVIDESGEDCAFAANRFYVVDLPTAVRKTLIPRLQPV